MGNYAGTAAGMARADGLVLALVMLVLRVGALEAVQDGSVQQAFLEVGAHLKPREAAPRTEHLTYLATLPAFMIPTVLTLSPP